MRAPMSAGLALLALLIAPGCDRPQGPAGPGKKPPAAAPEVVQDAVPPVATVGQKYYNLHHQFDCPEDEADYGKLHELGYRTETEYKGHTKLPAGFWVYAAPRWYIWGRCEDEVWLTDGQVLDRDDPTTKTLEEPFLTIPCDQLALFQMAFSPDSRHLAAFCYGSQVKIWDLSGECVATISQPDGQSIGHAAFSPDGTMMITTHKNGVTLWTWRPVARLRDLASPFSEAASFVVGAAVAPDNKTVAIAGFLGELAHVDVATGRIIARTEARTDFRSRAASFKDLVFAPDGKQLAAAISSSLHLWDFTAREPKFFERRSHFRVQYVHGGRSVATAGDRGLVVKDLASGHRIAVIETGRQHWVGNISADGRLAAFAHQHWPAEKAEVVIREVATGKRLGKIPLYAKAVALSPDGHTLATWFGRGEQIELWHVGSLHAIAQATDDLAASQPAKKTVPDWANHFEPPAARRTLWLGGEPRRHSRRPFVAFSSDRQFLATASASTLSLWNPMTGERLASAPLEGKCNRPLGFLAASNGLVVAAEEPTSDDVLARVYDIPGLTPRALRLPRPAEFVQAMAVSADGKTLGGLAWQGSVPSLKIVVWDVGTEQVLVQVDTASERGSALAFSPDGKTVAIGDSDGEVSLWDLQTGTRTAAWRVASRAGWVIELVFSPNGRFLAAIADVPYLGHYDGPPREPRHALSLRDVQTGEELKTGLESGRGAVGVGVAFSPDGSLLALQCGVCDFWLWDLTRRTRRREFNYGSFRGAMAFSPDGKTLATDGKTCIRLWDTAALLAKSK